MKKTRFDFQKMKGSGEKLAWITAYDTIRRELKIPVYSIGAGPEADGQLMIMSDLLGIFQAFTPKFVKKYADLAGSITNALATYSREVRSGEFPISEYTYNMAHGELEKLGSLIENSGGKD